MSSEAQLIAALKDATTQINRHGAVVIIIFGTIGNLLNLIVFTDRAFRNNPCTTYFWWSSLSSIVFIWFGLMVRILEGYGILWPSQNEPMCKTRTFISAMCWSMAAWSFVGASIDRYLCSSSSAAMRLKSTVRFARRYLIFMFIISALIFLQIFYCYEANMPNVPVACYTRNIACHMYNDWINILFNVIVPSGVMAGFGILSILNIRKRVVHPVSSIKTIVTIHSVSQNSSLKKIDQNLRRALFIQVSVVLLLSLPIAIQRFYASLTQNIPKSTLRKAIESLLYAIVVLLRFVAYSISFYLYMLSGSMFRATLKRKTQRIIQIFHKE